MSTWNASTATIIRHGASGASRCLRARYAMTASASSGNSGARISISIAENPNASEVADEPDPPDCAMMAALPYSDVNCANASPVISQPVAAQTTNASAAGATTMVTSTRARGIRLRGSRRRYVIHPTTAPAANAAAPPS